MRVLSSGIEQGRFYKTTKHIHFIFWTFNDGDKAFIQNAKFFPPAEAIDEDGDDDAAGDRHGQEDAHQQVDLVARRSHQIGVVAAALRRWK